MQRLIRSEFIFLVHSRDVDIHAEQAARKLAQEHNGKDACHNGEAFAHYNVETLII